MISGTASENRAFQDVIVPEASAGPSGLSVEEKAEIEAPVVQDAPHEAEMSREELEARIATIPVVPHTKVIAEHGRIVIEELDTPAIRKEKAQRKKAERRAAAAAAAGAVATTIPQTADVQMHNLEDADLSPLSELESEDGDIGQLEDKMEGLGGSQRGPSVAGPSKAPTPPPPPPREPGTVVLEGGKMLEGGTLGESSCERILLY